MSESAFFAVVQTPDTIGSGSTTYYTLTFDTDGGSAISAMDYPAGSNVILPKPVKSGYTFNGWYLNDTFTGEVVTSVVMSANKTVYAKFTQNA